MTKTSRVWAVLAAVFLFVACNQTTPKIAFKHAEKRGRLEKNGLRFVVMPDSSTQLVEVDVRYEVGAKEDPPGKAGLAHLVEHMMFQHKPDGPDTKPMMHFIGQLAVFFNAYTSNDTTHYMINARAEQLDSVIKIEAMRMHFGCKMIAEEEFVREREVVRNEIRGSMRTPEGQIFPMTLAAIYPQGHAYEQTVGGNDEQLSTITFQDVCDFMKKYYVPERATVIVAGGVTVEESVASITKWFSVVEKQAPGPLREVQPVVVNKQRKKTVELDIERPYITVAWALPDATTPKGEAAQFGIWSAFFDAANKADEYACATSTEPFIGGGQYAPVFGIAMELKNIGAADECLEHIWKAAKKAHRGWDFGTWVQHEETKNRRKASFISSLESLTGRTQQLGDMIQFTRDFEFDSQGLYMFHSLDKIGKFEMETVGNAVKGLLDPDKASIVVFKPNKAGVKGDRRSKLKFTTKSHDKKEIPEVDPAEARRPIKVATELKGLSGAKRYKLGNGMRVVLLPIDVFPVISAALIFDVGDVNSPGNPWLADRAAGFISAPMDGNATGRTGVGMGCYTTPDHTICSARGMNIYLDVVVQGLERLIRAGVYKQESVEKWQKSMKIAYKLRRPQQRLEFQRQQLAALYGPDHPYTKTGVGLPEYVGKVGQDALSSFRNKHFSAANATLVITGMFDIKQAESLISDHFGSWDKGHKDQPVSRDMPKRVGPIYVGVVGEEDPQIDVRITYPTAPGIDGQEAARMVITQMLNDRMWDIRAKLGSTYGTYARRDTRLGPSSYSMGGAIDAPRAGEALRVMRDSVDSLRKSADDFDVLFVRARRKLIQDLLGQSTMTSEVLGRLGEIAMHDLDPDHYNKLLQQVAAVSLAQVKALIGSELDPRNEIIVTLGDRGSIDKAFSDAGLPDVKLVEPDYK
ncbi:MAG: insulinase family protein [Deltaproteobacteria bacterium]|nr:insulinase family protein [Deltaproteobacteria bacterium]MDQ3298675.1 insulinase family protein [Myxococcota bacterium]